MPSPTYTISSADPALFGLEMVGCVTDALTGRTKGVFRSTTHPLGAAARYETFVLDEPLMDCCDQPADLCDCDALAPVERLADGRIAA